MTPMRPHSRAMTRRGTFAIGAGAPVAVLGDECVQRGDGRTLLGVGPDVHDLRGEALSEVLDPGPGESKV